MFPGLSELPFYQENIFLFGFTDMHDRWYMHISKGVSHSKHFLPLCSLSVYTFFSHLERYVDAIQSNFRALENLNERLIGQALACTMARVT